MINRTKAILWILSIYISIAGLVTFSLFISEEAFQTTMFGTWPAKDAQRWDIVKSGVNLMGKINTQSKIINYGAGWIQPLAFMSYRAYSKSADYYIESLSAEILAHSPELFLGERVKFEFTPRELSFTDNGRYIARNGNLGVISSSELTLSRIKADGILKMGQGCFVVEHNP